MRLRNAAEIVLRGGDAWAADATKSAPAKPVAKKPVHAGEVEVARFLEASALAHEGCAAAAGATAERFLALHPRSFHAKDASILAARAARDRGDGVGARAMLAPWLDPPSAEVIGALGDCAPR